jgi:hypothetical protein
MAFCLAGRLSFAAVFAKHPPDLASNALPELAVDAHPFASDAG